MTGHRFWQFVAPDWAEDPIEPTVNDAEHSWPGLWAPVPDGPNPQDNQVERLYAERLDLNLQRFARVMEFGTTVAFLGSGWSRALDYPAWNELLNGYPLLNEGTSVAAALGVLGLEGNAIDLPALFELVQADPARALRARSSLRNHIGRTFGRFEAKAALLSPNPYLTLLDKQHGIRRFVTTNFDYEIANALRRRRPEWTREQHLFAQDAPDRIAFLSLTGVAHNHEDVFHVHGHIFRPNVHGEAFGPSDEERDDLILTESDYKRWYLRDDPAEQAFRDALRVLLQSNSLFIAGYSLSDPDLVRTFRQCR